MSKRPKILAISSIGGHWVELLRLMPAWDGCDVHYATSSPDYRQPLEEMCRKRGQPVPGFHLFTDANRWQKVRLLRQAVEVLVMLVRLRPDVVITTGASVGYFAVRAGKLLGARTCWVDSIANAQELSLSGMKAGAHADLFLTQWPELAEPGGPEFHGAVV